jgi:amino acid permease
MQTFLIVNNAQELSPGDAFFLLLSLLHMAIAMVKARGFIYMVLAWCRVHLSCMNVRLCWYWEQVLSDAKGPAYLVNQLVLVVLIVLVSLVFQPVHESLEALGVL